MDPKDLQYSTLSRDRVADQLSIMEAMSADEAWLNWKPENYLAELPGKWDLSLEARIEGELVAYAICSLRGRFVWVHRLVTAQARRGEGIGSAVISELLERSRSAGRKGLLLKTPLANAKALAFYLENGFEQMPAIGASAILRRLLPRQSFAVGIHQPNYIPWLGYFYKIHVSDAFVFLDDVSFPTRSFVNRNRVCINGEARWLTIPLKREFETPIREAVAAEFGWHKTHLRSIELSYKKTPYFGEFFPRLAQVIESQAASGLADLNASLVEAIARLLGIGCLFFRSSDLAVAGRGEERILNLVKAVKGDSYVSGAGGANYQSQQSFEAAGVALAYSNFRPTPYPQVAKEFLGGLSVIDALFNVGIDGIRSMFDELAPASAAAGSELDHSQYE